MSGNRTREFSVAQRCPYDIFILNMVGNYDGSVVAYTGLLSTNVRSKPYNAHERMKTS